MLIGVSLAYGNQGGRFFPTIKLRFDDTTNLMIAKHDKDAKKTVQLASDEELGVDKYPI